MTTSAPRVRRVKGRAVALSSGGGAVEHPDDPRLSIAEDLSLPLEALTQTCAVLAMRGAGKSNVGVVLAEEFSRHGLPWVAVDPKGDWWGVRSSFDGTAPGLSAVVLGGDHGDVALPATAGDAVARLIVGEDLTCVLDVSEFSKRETIRFLTAFFDTLYRESSTGGVKRARTSPRHVFLEEADEYVPQQVRAEQAVLLGSVERMVKRGRFKGLGFTALTQRSASLNKNVLSQVDTLIAMRTTSPGDRKAIEGWVRDHDLGREMIASLPALASGEGWVSSPQWLPSHGGVALQRVSFHRRSTWDAGRTPDITGIAAAKPTSSASAGNRGGRSGLSVLDTGLRIAAVDIDAVRAALHQAVEAGEATPRTKSLEPARLREQVHDLTQETASLRAELQAAVAREEQARQDLVLAHKATAEAQAVAAAAEQVVGVMREVAVIVGDLRAAEATWHVALEEAARQRGQRLTDLDHHLADLPILVHVTGTPALPPTSTRPRPGHPGGEHSVALPDASPAELPGPAPAGATRGGGRVLTKAQRAVLAALVPYGDRPRTKSQVALMTGYSARGGGFNNALSSLRTAGLIHGGPDALTATAAGAKAVGAVAPLPTGDALIEHWAGQLPKAPRLVLQSLAAHGPLSKADVADLCGYEPSGGGFNNALSRLRTLGLITGPADHLKLNPDLQGR